MKFLTAILFLSFFVFSACKSKDEVVEGRGEPSEKEITAQTLETLLTQEEIKEVYRDAGSIGVENSSAMWPTRTFRFRSDGEEMRVTLSALLNEANAAAFSAAEEALGGSEIVRVAGFGDEAFYTGEPFHQLTVRDEDHLYHVAVTKGDNGHREGAEALMKRVLAK